MTALPSLIHRSFRKILYSSSVSENRCAQKKCEKCYRYEKFHFIFIFLSTMRIIKTFVCIFKFAQQQFNDFSRKRESPMFLVRLPTFLDDIMWSEVNNLYRLNQNLVIDRCHSNPGKLVKNKFTGLMAHLFILIQVYWQLT